jgi:uncharacterized protein
MSTYRTPGVRWVNEYPAPPAELRTGVPIFLGYAQAGPVDDPQALTQWPQFGQTFSGAPAGGYLADAVRGFFENGGDLCYVVRVEDALDAADALADGLAALASLDAADLVCVPDVAADPARAAVLQQQVLDDCQASGSRFAILDAVRGASVTAVLEQRDALNGLNGALYYPWIWTSAKSGCVPPCGHVAGVYTRTDRITGFHKAPANEVLNGVLDLEVRLADADQDQLNPEGVNCLRAFPGRGIRVWGARTVSADPAWRYVNVRRLFLTVSRWVAYSLGDVAWEPHDPALWARISRKLTTYCEDLHRRGALVGRTPQEAFYVKCDAETNPSEVRDAGMVVTEIGLAPTIPAEFIVVRVIHPTGDVSQVQEAAAGVQAAGMRIARIVYNPPGPDLPGEVVFLRNRGGKTQDLTGWTLSDLAGHTFIFPAFQLPPGGSVRVWTGAGTDTATDLHWGRGAAVWTNIGDQARLHDATGVLVDEYTYHPLDELISQTR